MSLSFRLNENEKQVEREVSDAYADCWIGNTHAAMAKRNLDFRASNSVSQNLAFVLFDLYVGSYNDFIPDLILKFPSDSLITIAREGSVCIYVRGESLPTKEQVNADEFSVIGDETRYWWD